MCKTAHTAHASYYEYIYITVTLSRGSRAPVHRAPLSIELSIGIAPRLLLVPLVCSAGGSFGPFYIYLRYFNGVVCSTLYGFIP